MYVVNKPRDLPKLHRAVWKADITKVKTVSNGIRKAILNSHDKGKRSALIFPLLLSLFINYVLFMQDCTAFGLC